MKKKHLQDIIRRESRDTARSYAVLAIKRGNTNAYSLLVSSHKKVVVFDTPAMAKEFAPRLGDGRITMWDAEGETCSWFPQNVNGINSVSILTNYDPYNLPPAAPVPSETPLKSWKYHIMWNLWFSDQYSNVDSEGNVYNEVDKEGGVL